MSSDREAGVLNRRTVSTFLGLVLAVALSPFSLSAREASALGAPVTSPIFAETTINIPVEIELQATDPENDPIQYSIFLQPQFGTLEVNGADVIYTPAHNFVGTDFFRFVASDGSESSLPTAVTINTAGPRMTLENITRMENSGPIAITFSLVGPMPSHVSFSYATLQDTAFPGTDFTAVSGVADEFTDTERVLTILIPLINDTAYEPDEKFFFRLTEIENVAIDNPEIEITITDDDPIPLLRITPVDRAEGNAGITGFTFIATLIGETSHVAGFRYVTVAETATAGSDYTHRTGVVSFLPGEKVKTVDIAVHGDTVIENDETFLLDITDQHLLRLVAPVRGTIRNDESYRHRAVRK